MENTGTKPLIFIGSSSEGLDVARAIEYQLQNDAEVTIWNAGVFGLGWSTLEALLKAVDQFDYAILILTPDDVIQSREQSLASPRDNVIFELGLFMGALGRFRTFALYDQKANLKILSDLAGITLATYNGSRADSNLIAAVSPACTLIRSKINEHGHKSRRESITGMTSSVLDAIATDQLQREIERRKKAAFVISHEDIAPYNHLLKLPNTGAAKLYSDVKLEETFGVTGGGNYFNFSTKSSEYGYGSDIAFKEGKFRTGFAGADYGYILMLGDIDPRLLFEAEAIPPTWLPIGKSEAWAYLWCYLPPKDIKEVRVHQREARGKRIEGSSLSEDAVALEGKSYLLRSIRFDNSDLLVGFHIIRILDNGAALMIWRILTAFDTPIMTGRED